MLFASIVNNRGRQMGRGGLGAVMGAKRLKAIVLAVEGGALPGPADPERFAAAIRDAKRQLTADPITSRSLPDFGTAVLINVLDQAGALPTRNFRSSRFELGGADQRRGPARRLRGQARRLQRLLHRLHAHHPRRRRERRRPEVREPLGARRRLRHRRPEGDRGRHLRLQPRRARHDHHGFDPRLRDGAQPRRACCQDGPRFGDAAALLELIGATAERRGLGDELAEGSRRFAARYGRPELAMQVKGLELPAYDPRGMTGQGLAFATSNRGACHLRANMLGPEILGDAHAGRPLRDPRQGGLLIHLQDLNAVLDSLVECKFAAFAIGTGVLRPPALGGRGETVETDELLRIGERIWTLEKLFNLRAGFAAQTTPCRCACSHEPVAEGPATGHVVDLPPMLDEYYAAAAGTRRAFRRGASWRSWDSAGPARIPRRPHPPGSSRPGRAPQARGRAHSTPTARRSP